MKTIVLLDGGMGQELMRRSTQKPHPMWSAKVLMDEPEIVEAVHLDYIRAGASVITLNNYAVTPERLARDGSAEMFAPLQARAIEIARAAREKGALNIEHEVQIAGCLPPLYASYRPNLVPPTDECVRKYRFIVEAQANDVDLFLCETMSSIREAEAAATAAKESGLPVWLSFSLEDTTSGCLRSGEPLESALRAVAKINSDAVLLNCSVPESIDSAIDILLNNVAVAGAYANGFTAVDALEPGGTVESLSIRQDLGPEAYADFALRWVKLGAKIIGGCCEVGPAHIGKLRSELEKHGYQITSKL